MTLHEIEETLRQLSSRHTGLDERTLVTLLRSGGWEEKNIQEAVLLFHSGTVPPAPRIELPPVETSHVLIPQADENHLLVEHTKEMPAKDELPHNLPLRPLEASEDSWPFSRYKDTLYEESEPQPKQDIQTEKKKEILISREPIHAPPPIPRPIPAPAPVVVPVKEDILVEPVPLPIPPLQVEKIEPVQSPQVIIIERPATAPPKGDGKLILMAVVMLVAVLLLLGYMYSNGRI